MKDNVQLLQSVWKSSKEFIAHQDTAMPDIDLDEIIASVFCAGPTFCFVVDFFNNQIDFITPNAADFLALGPGEITFNEIIAQVHPDDVPFVMKAEGIVIDYLYNKIGKDRVLKYKGSYCFRAKTPAGNYKMFHHQALILTTDENGRFGKSLNIVTDIHHITTVNSGKVSLLGLLGEPSFLNIDVETGAAPADPKPMIFSKREIEIIRLIADGHKINDIASKLFISTHTVSTHRKNILAKSNAKTTSELIATCIHEGWI